MTVFTPDAAASTTCVAHDASMANIETLDLSEKLSKEEGANGVQEESVFLGSSLKSADEADTVNSSDGSLVNSSISPSPPSGSASLPLRGTTSNGTTPGPTAAPHLTVPQPKKFSHININKRFLEKTSSSSGSGSSFTTSSTTKIGSVAQRPSPQALPPPSRLVTTKLTSGPQPSTLTGPGWSRPSSTGSSTVPTPLSSTNPKPSPLPLSTPTNSAPKSTSSTKVIQPQPRVSTEAFANGKESSSRPVWGAGKASPSTLGRTNVQNDFPTAAEAAQGRAAKIQEKKQAAQDKAAQAEALSAEADAFRGVHLDPHTHHWDEDEEEGDDFLSGVIEFEDGRQYTIPAEARNSPLRETSELTADGEGEPSTRLPGVRPPTDKPVSKAERFVDDFDRSWPRSRTSAPGTGRQPYHRPPSVSSSQSPHSPQESSRVLFNERSNRLEPYSGSQPIHRFSNTARDGLQTRRDSRSDHTLSPNDMRVGRDLPPHSQRQQASFRRDVSPQDGSSRSRVFGDRISSTSSHDSSWVRDKDLARRDNGAPMRRTSSQISESSRSRDRYSPVGVSHHPLTQDNLGRSEGRPRRLSTASSNYTSLLSNASGPHRDINHQPPPHLSNLQSSSPRLKPTIDLPSSQDGESSGALGVVSSIPLVQSPVSPIASTSPLAAEKPIYSSPLAGMDPDEMRKAAMHSAAERAKIRRLQDEEERERERERARRKAAEIEAKMKAKDEESRKQSEQEESDKIVTQIIEDAVKSVSTMSPDRRPQTVTAEKDVTSHPTAPTERTLRPASPLQGLHKPVVASTAPPFALEETGSWRSRAQPLPQRDQTDEPPKSAKILTPSSAPLKLPVVQALDLTLEDGDDVEIFDFSDLGKLVEKKSLPRETDPRKSPSRPARAVAADFFGSSEEPLREGTSESSWRGKHPVAESNPAVAQISYNEGTPDRQSFLPHDLPSTHQPPLSGLHIATDSNSDEHHSPHATANHNGFIHQPRSPVTPAYREPSMSTIDDTMARIRGAMQKSDSPVKAETHKPTPRWQTSAKRAPVEMHDNSPHEPFDVTGYEPPRSPKPAWNHCTVKLPRILRPRDLVSRKLFNLSKAQSVRPAIFSFEPPLDGSHRRDFNPNDSLFKRPAAYKKTISYVVVLPQGSSKIAETKGSRQPTNPVVHLPPRLSNQSNSLGRRRDPDGVLSWRKPPPSPLKLQSSDEVVHPPELDTTSRSPPPEAAIVPAVAERRSEIPTPSPPASVSSVKSKSQPKMPAGSDVAFYRSTVTEATVKKPTVNFTVSSELEQSTPTKAELGKDPLPPDVPRSPLLSAADPIQHPNSSTSKPEPIGPPQLSPPESKNLATFILSPNRITSNLSWSPKVIKPNPEHLKALWSQEPNANDAPSINSLEKIGDDLVPVPFVVPDVKSEDGETPPPNSNPPSRMSQHDVARSFQLVPPTSSSSSASLPQLSAPSTTVQRHSTHGLPHPVPPHPPASSMRTVYPAYPSPLMSSPTPAMVYPLPMTPSPIPRQMVVNGASPYPMWGPIPTPGSSQPTSMMRPVPTSYGPQLMAYPPPGSLPMYLPVGMQPPIPPPPSNGMQGRPPTGMSMMGAVAPSPLPSHPMYAGGQAAVPGMSMSPGYVGQNPQMRGRGGYDNGMVHHSSTAPSTNSLQYSPTLPNTFERPTW